MRELYVDEIVVLFLDDKVIGVVFDLCDVVPKIEKWLKDQAILLSSIDDGTLLTKMVFTDKDTGYKMNVRAEIWQDLRFGGRRDDLRTEGPAARYLKTM